MESYVALARSEGGTIKCGGARPVLPPPWNNGYFYQPTIITGISQSINESILFALSLMLIVGMLIDSLMLMYLIIGLPSTSRVSREEIFGPVITSMSSHDNSNILYCIVD